MSDLVGTVRYVNDWLKWSCDRQLEVCLFFQIGKILLSAVINASYTITVNCYAYYVE